MDKPQHIIISRTDNIGDVVLTLPLTVLLKQSYPNCKISFLARSYVKDLVLNSLAVDAFINWDEIKDLPEEAAIKILQQSAADTILHVFPNKKIASLAKVAGIKTRIGSSHRWYHWLTCNKRVNFSRKNSTLHEAQLNLKLLQPLELPTILSLSDLTTLLRINQNKALSEKIVQFLKCDRFNLVVHPLTNGNTKEWPLTNFIELIQALPIEKFNVIITGTAAEEQRLQSLLQQCPTVKNAITQLSLQDFIALLSHADGIVANSTGPLHIAAALGIYTLGLYPTERGKDVSRWGPLGGKVETLSAAEMRQITIRQVEQIIQSWLI